MEATKQHVAKMYQTQVGIKAFLPVVLLMCFLAGQFYVTPAGCALAKCPVQSHVSPVSKSAVTQSSQDYEILATAALAEEKAVKKFDAERTDRTILLLSYKMNDLSEATELVKAGDYEKALELFQKSLTGAVGRLSDLPLKESLSELLKNYPEAREPLTQTRDKLEERFEPGATPPPPNVYHEWTLLNEALGDDYRELELIARIKKGSGKSSDVLILTTIKYYFGKYLKHKRYDVLDPYINQLGTQFLVSYCLLEAEILFPTQTQKQREQNMEHQIEAARKEGAFIFEACLGLKRPGVAMDIANKVLYVASNVPTYKSLIQAAERVGCEDQKIALLERAKQDLSENEFKELTR